MEPTTPTPKPDALSASQTATELRTTLNLIKAQYHRQCDIERDAENRHMESGLTEKSADFRYTVVILQRTHRREIKRLWDALESEIWKQEKLTR